MHEKGLYPIIRDAARVAMTRAPIVGAWVSSRTPKNRLQN